MFIWNKQNRWKIHEKKEFFVPKDFRIYLRWFCLSLFGVHFLAAVSLQAFLAVFMSLICNVEFVIRKRSLSGSCFLTPQVCLKVSSNEKHKNFKTFSNSPARLLFVANPTNSKRNFHLFDKELDASQSELHALSMSLHVDVTRIDPPERQSGSFLSS